jgi:hypothetical protein
MAELYDQAVMFLNGALLTDNTTVSVSYEGDDQDVMTIPKGWAGITPSPRKLMVKFELLIPKDGPEFDLIGKFLNSEKVTLGLQLLGSGKKVTSDGYLRNPNMEFGVGQTAKISCEFHGEPKPLE